MDEQNMSDHDITLLAALTGASYKLTNDKRGVAFVPSTCLECEQTSEIDGSLVRSFVKILKQLFAEISGIYIYIGQALSGN